MADSDCGLRSENGQPRDAYGDALPCKASVEAITRSGVEPGRGRRMTLPLSHDAVDFQAPRDLSRLLSMPQLRRIRRPCGSRAAVRLARSRS